MAPNRSTSAFDQITIIFIYVISVTERYGARPTELNNALRMFVTSVLSSTLVPRAAILSASTTDRSSGLWKICE